jgi:5-bromo-4-chloroindolyl phosphate hydrolysis protein
MAKEISISEASKKYNQPIASIRFWIKNKRFPAVKKKIGNSKVEQFRINVPKFEKFLKENGLLKTVVDNNIADSTPIGRKVFDFVQQHPQRFASMTLGEITEFIKALES